MTHHWTINSFFTDLSNEKQSMFTFAFVFLQAIDIVLLIFNLFPLFTERGRRNLEEIIHNENHWPQLLQKPGVECQIDRFACFAAYSLFIFSERKCISKSWRKLMNYKPEKRIPWLFTDFDNIKDFPWLFPNLEKFSFFPGFSLTVATLW